jgi:hypothetical protein
MPPCFLYAEAWPYYKELIPYNLTKLSTALTLFFYVIFRLNPRFFQLFFIAANSTLNKWNLIG